ncbi:competence type IV pilus minor pilin ComGG [Cytobacillus depressus]|uniref:competence type IV pilus minor pilin ComGG n=1 Tax=Cytobacillus depressus TaxID=1602942 RepID=UPI001478A212|nr:competence type IV pilus minor pilin ComGG [Cytobacillus depressus]
MYPLTFSIIILAVSLLIIHIELYLSEVRFYKETEKSLKQEYYFLSSVKEIERIFLEEDTKISSGELKFSDGNVHYRTSEISNSVYLITFSLSLEDHREITAYGYFDLEEGKMFKWVERN